MTLNGNFYKIWFWQSMFTPHMAGLAAALADRGHKVYFIANQFLSEDRKQLGWRILRIKKVKFLLATNKNSIIKLAQKASLDSIHLFQGLRSNGILTYSQKILRTRGLRQLVMMETVDNKGFRGLCRRIIYRNLFLDWNLHIEGVLAIGRTMADWVVEQGFKREKVYPFAYFINKPIVSKLPISFNNPKRTFRFIFVGQLIKRKRIDCLIRALENFNKLNFELWVIGKGEEESSLKLLANKLLPNRVRWFGVQPINLVPKLIQQADCLVLPSRHDGWGVVVSEALMVGTPVICSSECGSSIAVFASKEGFVFQINNQLALINSLRKQFRAGKWKLSQRKKLVKWANCISANAGAIYLEKILDQSKYKSYHPIPPWKVNIYKK